MLFQLNNVSEPYRYRCPFDSITLPPLMYRWLIASPAGIGGGGKPVLLDLAWFEGDTQFACWPQIVTPETADGGVAQFIAGFGLGCWVAENGAHVEQKTIGCRSAIAQ